MTTTAESPPTDVARFRTRLLISMMVVVSAVTAFALHFGQRRLARAAEAELHREFEAELAALQNVQALRHATLAERCRALVRRPRIHAALEDDALDLLYPSAADELRDLMADPANPSSEHRSYALHAAFYRFLDRSGSVLPASPADDAGVLGPDEERQLALPRVPTGPQLGFITARGNAEPRRMHEVFVTPILSSETGEPIAALALGFRPAVLDVARGGGGIRRGLWLDGELLLDAVPGVDPAALSAAIGAAVRTGGHRDQTSGRQIAGPAHLLFYKRLNAGSLYAPAYEVCVYPLTALRERQRDLSLQVAGTAVLLLAGGFAASHLLSRRLARPVERLAVDSAEQRAQRVRAEAALELTSEELQRAARFSADASHQLKTPVTVLRAGLEELLARDDLSAEEAADISALIHQTYRLSGVIEDLLLLSRMDAGRLVIDFQPVDLTYLIETALDDLSAQTNDLNLTIDTDIPPDLRVHGEKRYLGLILQNLLENARKYNRPGGRIHIAAREEAGDIRFAVGNTGRPIPPDAQAHIFERFHRGAIGENVPGYGLGLNLARELARLHRGELRLVQSNSEWTEFELRLASAHAVAANVPAS